MIKKCKTSFNKKTSFIFAIDQLEFNLICLSIYKNFAYLSINKFSVNLVTGIIPDHQTLIG